MDSPLPHGWARANLGFLLPLAYGKSLVKTRRDTGGSVPVYGSSGLLDYHSQALIQEPTLIVGRKGNVGEVYYSPEPCWVIDTAYFTQGAKSLNLRFFIYMLRNLSLKQHDRSTAVPGLSREDYNKIDVSVPPEEEQRRIVGEIEKQLTRLDAAVTALKRVHANLKRYRAAVLKAACEGRLITTEAELARREGRSYDPASELLKRILTEGRFRWETAQAAKFQDGTERSKRLYPTQSPPHEDNLSCLPNGWIWTTLSALVIDGPQNGLYLPKSRYGSGIPILRIDDFQNDSSRASEELQKVNATTTEAEAYSLRINDLVINRVNSPTHLGKSLLVQNRNLPAIFESNMMRLSLCSLVHCEFVILYLQSVEGRSRLTCNAKWAVNQASINQKDVLSTPVPLPPRDEQHKIAIETERRLSIVAEMESEVAANLARAERLRQAILKRAFEGTLVPQDPNDEPADVLLDRIREERAQRTQRTASDKAKRPPRKKELAHAQKGA